MPATETIDFEREFADLVRELRAVPSDAPRELRERVRALGEPEPRRAFRFPRITRRTVFVLVPACVLAVVAAAVVRGLVASSGSQHPIAALGHASASQPARARPARLPHRAVFGAPTLQKQAPLDNAFTQGAVPAPNPNRYQDYQGFLRLRVNDFDSLGSNTAKAMQITQSFGGYVASVEQSTTSGAPGEADLVLRVPVAHVQAAMIKLSQLGTVLDQHVSITDLNALVNAQRQRILQLKIQIARITAALQQSLSTEERLRLEFQLGDAKRNLASLTGANRSTLRAATMSRIELALTTEKAAIVKHHRSFLGRSTHAAIVFLAGAGAIALAALIVLSPLLVLAVLAWLGVRTYRRREERRLLAAS
jgi:Domain of unknown function (DUF4349)